jgi:peptidoglycan hydrolase CwlO-like protein
MSDTDWRLDVVIRDPHGARDRIAELEGEMSMRGLPGGGYPSHAEKQWEKTRNELAKAKARIAELEGEVALMNEKLDVWQAKWHEAINKADELEGRMDERIAELKAAIREKKEVLGDKIEKGWK